MNYELKNLPPIEKVFETVVIDDAYIKKNMMPNGKGISAVGGHAEPNKNRVVILTYVISPGLSPEYYDKAEKIVAQRNDIMFQKRTYTHEAQHIHNHFGEFRPDLAAHNAREYLVFLALDELTAFMATELIDKPLSETNITDAARVGMDKIVAGGYFENYFLNALRWYIKHNTNNKNLWDDKIDSQTWNKIINHYFEITHVNVLKQLSNAGRGNLNVIINQLSEKVGRLIGNEKVIIQQNAMGGRNG